MEIISNQTEYGIIRRLQFINTAKPVYSALLGLTKIGVELPRQEESRKMPRDWLVTVLFILLGISSWVAVNGLWVELPVLVQRLPESWYLASYLVALVQVANLGPLAYSVLRRLFNKNIEGPAIHSILLVGCLSTGILPFVWNKITPVLGRDHSVAFLALAFTLALVDCTSSVLYFPYMASFRKTYLMPLLIGEGLSGLLPGLVALVQGVGGNPQCVNKTQPDGSHKIVPVPAEPRFSIEVFFFILLGLLILSWVAFILIRNLQRAKAARVPSNSTENLSESGLPFKSTPSPEEVNFSGRKSLYILLGMQAFICCLSNGVLPAIQTFSALPYGNSAYHFAVTLASIANPTACFITIAKPAPNFATLWSLLGVVMVAAGYILTTAVMSPAPPLVGMVIGGVLVVAAWVIFSGVGAYLRASIASILRTVGGHSALFNYGAVMQAGSCVGAISIFLVVNYASVFHAYSPC
ncbi:SLC52A3 [Cordylochernes scorpioides]|uniref:Riboflavin transporter n=1 Tax=Cordylochernes scorpioides TaxID=51811 RepID=A0ABY6LR59_9ARAC|nr:SLC52A3 [Cordylochernes scorpioides]